MIPAFEIIVSMLPNLTAHEKQNLELGCKSDIITIIILSMIRNYASTRLLFRPSESVRVEIS